MKIGAYDLDLDYGIPARDGQTAYMRAQDRAQPGGAAPCGSQAHQRRSVRAWRKPTEMNDNVALHEGLPEPVTR